MKQLLLFILLCIGVPGFSQNGGQFNENSMLKIEYQSLSDYHKITIINKQTCETTVRTNFDGLFEDNISIAGKDTAELTFHKSMIKGDTWKVKAKPLNDCTSGGDMGWVELRILFSLPISFKTLYLKEIFNGQKLLVFSLDESPNIIQYEIEVSDDGRTWKTHTLIFTEDKIIYQPKTYQIKL